MTQSATTGATARRSETRGRITRCARELTLQHGLDGFTMEQLAEHVGVSRRTLFNYFPKKYDALLGGDVHVDPTVIDTFRAGGPTGDLVEDLLVVADQILTDRSEAPADAVLGRQVLAACPALTAHACAGFDQIITEFLDHLRAREGDGLDPATARVLLTTVAALGDLAFDQYVDTGGSVPPATLLRRQVADLRRLLA